MQSPSFSKMVAESEANSNNCKIGARIECGGDIGTVKYVGPVEGHPGSWLGIDWDDYTRGKHNGRVNGIQYFETRHPKSGSFVRINKVNFGQSAIDSIKFRYGEVEDEQTAQIYEQEILQFQKLSNAPFFQRVGFEKVHNKQSDFDSLSIVNIRFQNVSSIGEPYELQRLCPNIRELDISKNLLNSWLDVFKICEQLEHLIFLNVSENIMNIPECKGFVFPNVTMLVCGRMNLNWMDIMQLSKAFPNVEELRVQHNNITNFNGIELSNFQQLQLLDLEGNDIQDWEEIKKLSSISTLKKLLIEDIHLDSINIEDNENLFPNLKKLNINKNNIKDWRSIGELNKLKALEELFVLNNPILDSETLPVRTSIITAMIGNLRVLNGGKIIDEERRGSEYDYIKKYGLEYIQAKENGALDEFWKQHNRYAELINKYGAPVKEELVIKPNTIKSHLVTLNIVYQGKTVSKKFPPTITVQKLIMMVKKMFKLEERPSLLYMSSASPNIEIKLDDELKEISYYTIEDDDVIVVQV